MKLNLIQDKLLFKLLNENKMSMDDAAANDNIFFFDTAICYKDFFKVKNDL